MHGQGDLKRMSEKIGFILGEGELALKAVKNALKDGVSVYIAAFDKVGREFEGDDVTVEYFKLGEVGRIIDFFKKNGVKKVVLIGNISHKNAFSLLSTDLRGTLFLMKLKDKTPLGIFKAVKEELSKEGIAIEQTTRFLQDSILKKGSLYGRLTEDELEQINYGFRIAKNIAAMDIGLCVIVKDFCVVAVEALEGTDQCIKRAGEILGKRSGFIMVKVARPSQDMSFDPPVIGSKTVLNVAQAGGKVIACEGDKTLVADYERMIETAKEFGIKIYGI